MLDVMEGARNCAIHYGHVRRGEKVLVLTDTRTDERRASAIAQVCREEGAEVTVMIMKAQDLPNQEPPKAVSDAMKAVDITFAPLYYTISHTKARFAANEAGAAYMGLYEPDIDAMASEGARFPAEILFEVAKKVARQWQNGKRIHITCEKGTDISGQITVPYNNVVGEGCLVEDDGEPLFFRKGKKKGASGPTLLFGNFAGGFGAVGVWPAWTAEGVIYFDAAHTFKGRLKTPVKYTVEKGQVVRFEGEPEHVAFYDGIVKRFGKDARHLAEFMIGLNPKTRINLDDPTHMEAHRHAGALHCAIGQSVDWRRSVSPGIHLDNWIQRPTIHIDDQPCVKEGKLLVYYEDPEIQALLKKYHITL
jgi:leucyl aminopeptidase (aminopeptidase T)